MDNKPGLCVRTAPAIYCSIHTYQQFLLHQLVKLWHPAEGEMAVGQEHPVALGGGEHTYIRITVLVYTQHTYIWYTKYIYITLCLIATSGGSYSEKQFKMKKIYVDQKVAKKLFTDPLHIDPPNGNESSKHSPIKNRFAYSSKCQKED